MYACVCLVLRFCWCFLAGDSSRGGAEGLPGPEGGSRCHERVTFRNTTALPADPEHHFCRKELHHHFPTTHKPFGGFDEKIGILFPSSLKFLFPISKKVPLFLFFKLCYILFKIKSVLSRNFLRHFGVTRNFVFSKFNPITQNFTSSSEELCELFFFERGKSLWERCHF